MLLINQNFLFPWLSENSFSLECSPDISNLDNSKQFSFSTKMALGPFPTVVVSPETQFLQEFP